MKKDDIIHTAGKAARDEVKLLAFTQSQWLIEKENYKKNDIFPHMKRQWDLDIEKRCNETEGQLQHLRDTMGPKIEQTAKEVSEIKKMIEKSQEMHLDAAQKYVSWQRFIWIFGTTLAILTGVISSMGVILFDFAINQSILIEQVTDLKDLMSEVRFK